MDEIKQINLEPVDVKVNSNSKLVEEAVMEPKAKKNLVMPVMIIVGVVAGLVAGYFYAQSNLLKAGGSTPTATKLTQNPTSASAVKVGDTFGTADEKTFRDSAEGIMQPGGIDGEGSHHIERGENKSQWVYVTSSVVDLDMFVGSRVMVWGETNSSKKAGWLMDVGKLKVLELNAAEINNIEPAE